MHSAGHRFEPVRLHQIFARKTRALTDDAKAKTDASIYEYVSEGETEAAKVRAESIFKKCLFYFLRNNRERHFLKMRFYRKEGLIAQLVRAHA